MGHRALVAYERPNSSYNIHYTHWGGLNLRLTHELTPQRPFGGERPDDQQQVTFEQLLDATTIDAIDTDAFDRESTNDPSVRPQPMALGVSFDELLEEHLNYLSHEALYVVNEDFQVTAYRTHWFGLQYDAESVTDEPKCGNGAVRTVRWYNGEPVGDGYVQGEFQALKSVVGELVDRGVFTRSSAVTYMAQKLSEWTSPTQDLHIWTP
ncbi:DUF6735 family protein [Haloarcula salina]|uniref:Uncharacterized protein n=1 Tax=Haloarcula salina TaxID=1429914 RepID=A0AA41GB21_9EURY|nr:DUF6735 family protein [Haloarcula salina]MBV0903487.1 hypothetical protein [Haloarcula salina]